jgi:hypothetical protein
LRVSPLTPRSPEGPITGDFTDAADEASPAAPQASPDEPDTKRTHRICQRDGWENEIPEGKRKDARYCGDRCQRRAGYDRQIADPERLQSVTDTRPASYKQIRFINRMLRARGAYAAQLSTRRNVLTVSEASEVIQALRPDWLAHRRRTRKTKT